MKVTESELKDRPKPWVMPQPKIPVVRWWFGDHSGQPCTAIVTRAFRDTIDVMVFPPGDLLPMPKLGCRHISDPSLKGRTEGNPGGLFELVELEATIEKLRQDSFSTD